MQLSKIFLIASGDVKIWDHRIREASDGMYILVREIVIVLFPALPALNILRVVLRVSTFGIMLQVVRSICSFPLSFVVGGHVNDCSSSQFVVVKSRSKLRT